MRLFEVNRVKEVSFRGMRLAALAALVATLAACASAPSSKAQAPAAPPSLEEFLSSAAQARTEGSRAKERDVYRAAATAYPTAKEPWLKLAEGYFDEADYGNTILSAQEALQRESHNAVANSLLAVSGLRVASSALTSIRRDTLGTDARSQAEAVVKQLRELLGEPVLVPKPRSEQPSPPAVRKPRPAPTPNNTKKEAPAKDDSNPFDKLK